MGHSPILPKRVADPFYADGPQPHFTQTGHSPILRRRVTAPFYADGSQPHFTQTGRSPILRKRVADPFYEKTASAVNSVRLRSIPSNRDIDEVAFLTNRQMKAEQRKLPGESKYPVVS